MFPTHIFGVGIHFFLTLFQTSSIPDAYIPSISGFLGLPFSLEPFCHSVSDFGCRDFISGPTFVLRLFLYSSNCLLCVCTRVYCNVVKNEQAS